MTARSAAPRLPVARRLPRPSWRLPAIAVALVAAVGGGWLWLRDSPLVRVERVSVSGANGFGAAAVRGALEAAARDMTTLNVDLDALRSAVARYPLVADVEAHPDPPHGLRIVVHERRPVGVIAAAGSAVVVADDGRLLRGVPAEGLPTIVARVPPGGSRVADRPTRAKVALLAAAPRAIRRRVTRVTMGPYGLMAIVQDGPRLRFGSAQRLRAKWLAALRVMAEPGAAQATYIDLRVPERPAAGGLSEAQGGAPQTAVSSLDPSSVASEDPGIPPLDQQAAAPTGATTP